MTLPTGPVSGLRHYHSLFPSPPLTVGGPITHCTVLNSLFISIHQETVEFIVTMMSSTPIILGHRWLLQYNPLISWTDNCSLQWPQTCRVLCLVAKAGTWSKEKKAPNIDLSSIPEEYRDLAEVFSKKSAVQLPTHHPYDLAIDLLAFH